MDLKVIDQIHAVLRRRIASDVLRIEKLISNHHPSYLFRDNHARIQTKVASGSMVMVTAPKTDYHHCHPLPRRCANEWDYVSAVVVARRQD